MSDKFLNFVVYNREQADRKRLKQEWHKQSPASFCSDYSEKNNTCKLCASVFRECSYARLVRCTSVPKRINVKLSQQKLF